MADLRRSSRKREAANYTAGLHEDELTIYDELIFTHISEDSDNYEDGHEANSDDDEVISLADDKNTSKSEDVEEDPVQDNTLDELVESKEPSTERSFQGAKRVRASRRTVINESTHGDEAPFGSRELIEENTATPFVPSKFKLPTIGVSSNRTKFEHSNDDESDGENDFNTDTQDFVSPSDESARDAIIKPDTYRYREGIEVNQQSFATPPEIVDDLVKKCSSRGLDRAVAQLNGRALKVATLCAGSESPMIGMRLMSDSLKRQNMSFKYDHEMSAELVPWKQAYIQSNFEPKVLLRDITDFHDEPNEDGELVATTAYGSKAVIPSNLDMVVCGFCCVDFSALNHSKKDLEELGESGDTFQATIAYLRTHRPRFVVLENVQNAPWNDAVVVDRQKSRLANAKLDQEDIDNKTPNIAASKRTKAQKADRQSRFDKAYADIEKIGIPQRGIDWHLYQAGYASLSVMLDSKTFYLPQTRQRGYLLAVNLEIFAETYVGDDTPIDIRPKIAYAKARKMLENWALLLAQLSNRASVPVEVMLAAVSDDTAPNVCILEEVDTTGNKKPCAWAKCREIHTAYRRACQLGVLHPLTFWRDNGQKKLPDHWPPAKGLTERVLDTLDSAHLRNVRRGIDDRYYNRFLDLSQNVHRVTDTTMNGIIGCLTPHGIPWITAAGRRVSGREALTLQGLPVNLLDLSQLTEGQLQNFTGNAMSLPVVTAACMAALATFYEMLPANEDDQQLEVPSTGPSSVESCIETKQTNPTKSVQPISVADATNLAGLTRSLCDCEGRHDTHDKTFMKCTVCHHTRCIDCFGNPSHSYERIPVEQSSQRLLPFEFEKILKAALPPLLGFGQSFSKLADYIFPTLADIQHDDIAPPAANVTWEALMEAYEAALTSELSMVKVDRGETWTVLYKSQRANAVLTLDGDNIEWLLYAICPEPPILADPLQQYCAQHPIARFRPVGESLMDGFWELWRPETSIINADVTSHGTLTASFKNQVGLPDKSNAFNWTLVTISVPEDSANAFEVDISGDYQLNRQCGQAFNSLHVQTSSLQTARPLYFFFDHLNQRGDPRSHSFVFTHNARRVKSIESRIMVATASERWRQPQIYRKPTRSGFAYKKKQEPEEYETEEEVVVHDEMEIRVDGYWLESSMSMTSRENALIVYQHLPVQPVISPNMGCDHSIAILTCETEISFEVAQKYSLDTWVEVGPHNVHQVFADFGWSLQQALPIPGYDIARLNWHSVVTDNDVCRICTPASPATLWAMIERKNGSKLTIKEEAFEDSLSAVAFEKLMKERPTTTSVLIQAKSNGMFHIHVNVNPISVCHRAISNLCPGGDTDGVESSWTVITDAAPSVKVPLIGFIIPGTRSLIAPAEEFFLPGRFQLRTEQRKPVKWLIDMEMSHVAYLQEVIVEDKIQQANLLLWGRARKEKPVKGAFCFHPVGFGKTAVVLALTHMQRLHDRQWAYQPEVGAIRLKATMIIVPSTISSQWVGEVEKFLGPGANFLHIDTCVAFKRHSVARMQEADVIIVNWNVFASPAYATIISQFAGMLTTSTNASNRAKNAHHRKVVCAIEQNVDILRSSPDSFVADVEEQFEQNLASAAAKDLPVPSKRVSGAQYRSYQQRKNGQSAGSKAAKSEKPSAAGNKKRKRNDAKSEEIQFKLAGPTNSQDYSSTKEVPLEAYRFARVVVDEYPYMCDELRRVLSNIKTKFTVMLSATPDLDTFESVREMADLVGINLGVPEYTSMAPDVLRKFTVDMTASEKFTAIKSPPSEYWHIQRNTSAQRFLSLCARTDLAEIGDIPTHTRYSVFRSPVTQMVTNIELTQRLANNGLEIPPGHFSLTNRDIHLKEVLSNAQHAVQAIMKHSILFYDEVDEDVVTEKERPGHDLTTSWAASATTEVRDSQYHQLGLRIEDNMKKACWLQFYGGLEPSEQFNNFRLSLLTNTLGDEEVHQDLAHLMDGAVANHDSEDHKYWYLPEGQSYVEGGLHNVPKGSVKSGGKKADARMTELRTTVRDMSNDVRLLVILKRAHRLMKNAFACQTAAAHGNATELTCESCDDQGFAPKETIVLTECGHIVCERCIHGQGTKCPVLGCHADSMAFQRYVGNEFRHDEGQFESFPSESEKLRRLLYELGRTKNDRTLLFVQDGDCITKIEEYLLSVGINSSSLNSQVNSAKVLEDFQKLESDSRVLILNIGDSSAAGANLTIANRVIFMAPYLTHGSAGQRKWTSAMQQAIGRAVRYGQTKKVVITHFMTAKTAEVDVFEHRNRKILALTGAPSRAVILRDPVSDADGNLEEGVFASKIAHLVKQHLG